MSIRIGSSPTAIRFQITEDDRHLFSLSHRYMTSFHEDRFILTPDDHSSFRKLHSNLMTQLPNGTLVMQATNPLIIDPYEGDEFDYPYFKIDHVSKQDTLSDHGIVRLWLPDPMKPLRRCSAEIRAGLPTPRGRPRGKLLQQMKAESSDWPQVETPAAVETPAQPFDLKHLGVLLENQVSIMKVLKHMVHGFNSLDQRYKLYRELNTEIAQSNQLLEQWVPRKNKGVDD